MAGGYALDMKPNGFGLIELGYHAAAAHAPPLTDGLYLVLDEVNEPVEAYLPVASSMPLADPATIVLFDGDEANLLVYRWKSKLNIYSRSVLNIYCRIQAESYNNMIANFYGDGQIIMTQTVTSADVFTLPTNDAFREYEVELVGTDTVQHVILASTMEKVLELTERLL